VNLLKEKIENLSTASIGDYDKNFQEERIHHYSEYPQNVAIRLLLKHLVGIYEKSGFLYPEKRDRIAPYMDLILDNWQAALKLDDQILNVVKFKGKNSKKEQLTSISFWRSTLNSWVAQHLVSTGFPVGVCAMMLKAQAEVNIEKHRYKSFQNWFSKNNAYANLVFGTLVKTIGKQHSNVELYSYMGVNKITKRPSQKITISYYQHDRQKELYNFYCKIRGKIDAEAEEINEPDMELDQLDQLYQKVGLRRKRYVWLASYKQNKQIVGAAIAYRGPFGFNFSLIENRCDLLIESNISIDERQTICHNLLTEASKAYFENQFNMAFPIKYFPVVTDANTAVIIKKAGGELLREYNKSIWLHQAFEGWYQHIQKQYDNFLSHLQHKKQLNQ